VRSVVVFALLAGCSLGPAPGISPPAPADCVPIERGILGTWTRATHAMEVRADGLVVRNGVEHVIRWTAPGHASIDGARGHEEHTFALATAAQLLDVDGNGEAYFWTRVSYLPAYPERCFELRGSIVGDWSDGMQSESFQRDGSYERGDTHGNWAITEPGVLEIALGLSVRRYRVALSTPDLLISSPVDAPAIERDPRGPSLVETRLR
jgi:hypothetical protein